MSFDFKKDPFLNFQSSFQEAQLKGVPDHNGMALSTVIKNGNDILPSNRVVLFKGFVRGGFSFYTNYNGRKGTELSQNQNVAALFWWAHLDLQIRIEGQVEQLTADESDQYYWSRPRLSQIGAWASTQSQELSSFAEFHSRVDELEAKYKGQKIPRPPHWGGYRIIPREFDFLFLKPGRLHERYIYQRTDQKGLSVQSFSDYTWKTFLRNP